MRRRGAQFWLWTNTRLPLHTHEEVLNDGVHIEVQARVNHGGITQVFVGVYGSNGWAIGDTSSQSTRLGQSMGRSPTVFNFFRPGYGPPASAITGAGLVAPEFQITNEISVVAYINYMATLITATGEFKADYADALSRAADSQGLVDDTNMLLAAGQVSAATVASIKAAVDSFGSTGSALGNRVATAILLTMASPEYLTQK